MTKERRKAPSRVRYEESHPTVSCRVSRELYDRLQDIKRREKKSFAGILKAGLGILTSDAEKEDKAYRKGYDRGYKKAENEFKVIYQCSVCGKIISLNSEDEKRAAAKYMQEHGWGHAQCHTKKVEGHL